jgi:multidrug efflux pump subunit AcrA (membrane-fusion protein)
MKRWLGTGRGRGLLAVLAVAVAGGLAWWASLPALAADVPLGDVMRGDYEDTIEIRGDVRPLNSTFVKAPYDAGELQILKLAPDGSAVKAGDVVAEFDAVNLRRTVQEKESELRSATAERAQAMAQAEIDEKEKQEAVRKAEYDVLRARLNLGDIELVSEVEAERARLALADAEQRLKEAQAAAEAARTGRAGQFQARDRRIERIRADLAKAQRSVQALEVTAPTDGTVSIMTNCRLYTPTGCPDFKAGDRAYPGATILELPDLSIVYLLARLDEGERGPIKTGMPAVIRADAVPDREYGAEVTDISLLARPDYSNWPPAKLFDVKLTLTDPDGRLRPGMSAVARIPVGRLPGVLLVPADSVFSRHGATVVYRAGRRGFEPVPVEVIRRGRAQAAVAGPLEPGDRVALVEPGQTPAGGGGPQ